MIPPAYSPVDRSSIEGVEEGVFKVVQPISKQVGELTKVLTGKVGIDNERREIRSFAVTHNSEVQVKAVKVRSVIGVDVLWTEEYSPWRICWAPIDEKTFKMKVLWDSAPSVPKLCRFVIEGE